MKNTIPQTVKNEVLEGFVLIAEKLDIWRTIAPCRKRKEGVVSIAGKWVMYQETVLNRKRKECVLIAVNLVICQKIAFD